MVRITETRCLDNNFCQPFVPHRTTYSRFNRTTLRLTVPCPRDSCIAFSWDTGLYQSTVLATKQTGPQSGRLRGLEHFATASQSIWKNNWLRNGATLIRASLTELSNNSGRDCVGASKRKEDTLSIRFKRSDCLTAAVLINRIFWMILFRLWFLSNTKAYFPETSHHHLKYVWLSRCKIIFNSVKLYSCYFWLYLDTVHVHYITCTARGDWYN